MTGAVGVAVAMAVDRVSLVAVVVSVRMTSSGSISCHPLRITEPHGP